MTVGDAMSGVARPIKIGRFITWRPVFNRRIASAGGGVASICRAFVAIARTLDALTEHGIFTDARHADTRKTMKVTGRVVFHRREVAYAVCRVASALGAFALVVAGEAFA